MQRYARIVDDTVFQVTEAIAQPAAQYGEWVVCSDNVGPGFVVNASRTTFTAPPPPAPPSPVPAKITMRQARLALFTAGLLNAVNTTINALPSPAKDKALIEWEYSNDVLRHNGFVEQLAPALGLTDAQIDALFITGAAL